MSPVRVWLTTQVLQRELLHQRAGWVILLLSGGLVLLGGMLRSFHFGPEEPRFILGAAEFSLRWGGVLLLGQMAVALMRGGVASGLAGLFLTRGLSRLEWLAAVWLALLAAMGALVATCAGGLAATLVAAGHAAAVPAALAQLALGAGPLVIVSAAALVGATLARSGTLAVFLTLGVALAAQLAPIIRLALERSEGFARVGWRLMDFLVPDFSIFVVGAGPGLAAYAAAYAGCYFAAAAWLIHRRDA